MVADLYIGVPASSRKTNSQREWHAAPKTAVGLGFGSREG